VLTRSFSLTELGHILTHWLSGSTRPNTWTTLPPTTNAARTPSNPFPISLNRAKRKTPKTPRLQADHERDLSGAGRNNDDCFLFRFLILHLFLIFFFFILLVHSRIACMCVILCSFLLLVLSLALHCSGSLFLLLLLLLLFCPIFCPIFLSFVLAYHAQHGVRSINSSFMAVLEKSG
jgi:hypothetical protein